MKALAKIIISFMTVVLTACPPEPPPPPETCTDEIQNQDETGIDCGGSKCVECFDCFSDYCVYLSGSTPPGEQTSIKWKCTIYNGEPIDKIDCNGDLGCEIYKSIRLKFFSKGRAEFTGNEGGPVNGKWEFNDPEDPGLITIVFDVPSPDYGEQELLSFSSLSENELILTKLGQEGKFEPY